MRTSDSWFFVMALLWSCSHSSSPESHVDPADAGVDSAVDIFLPLDTPDVTDVHTDDATSPCPEHFSAHSDRCVRWSSASVWPSFGPHTSTLLEDGRVLVVGPIRRGDQYATHALFDSRNESWVLFDDERLRRDGHTANLLHDGRVLILGGHARSEGEQSPDALVYDPSTEALISIARAPMSRTLHAAAVVRDGRVLVVGGRDADGIAQATTSLYDPVDDTWAVGEEMRHARSLPTLSHVADTIVVVGGHLGLETERYDPASGAWWEGEDLPQPVSAHSVTALSDNALMLISGSTDARRKTIWSFWDPVAEMSFLRSAHAALRLPDDELLVVGGAPHIELYDPALDGWVDLGPAPAVLANTTMVLTNTTTTLLPDGRVLVVGQVPFILSIQRP